MVKTDFPENQQSYWPFSKAMFLSSRKTVNRCWCLWHIPSHKGFCNGPDCM